MGQRLVEERFEHRADGDDHIGGGKAARVGRLQRVGMRRRAAGEQQARRRDAVHDARYQRVDRRDGGQHLGRRGRAGRGEHQSGGPGRHAASAPEPISRTL